MTRPELIAAVMLGALALYALTAGADFGGGVWDLLARGRRAAAQRRLIDRAIAPIWEANHVWLILVVTILFTAFPAAYAQLAIDLHVPITLALLGIVLRGSAFVFRHHGDPEGPAARRWGRVFAIASTATPFSLGVVVAGVTTGSASTAAGAAPSALALGTGMTPLAIAVGALALAGFALLAAVYLTCEAGADAALAADFRRRAIAAAAAVAAGALACAVLVRREAPRFADRLFGSWWSAPLVAGTAAVALATAGFLLARRYRAARLAAAAEVGLVVLGWGLAQYPVLLAPGLTLHQAAAPPATLRLLTPVLLGGAVVLFPSLFWLLRVFKRDRDAAVGTAGDSRDTSEGREAKRPL